MVKQVSEPTMRQTVKELISLRREEREALGRPYETWQSNYQGLVTRWIKGADLMKSNHGIDGFTNDPEKYKIMSADDKIYRIEIHPEDISVVCFGVDGVDPRLEGEYSSIDELPDWVQARIAILSILPCEPPTEEIDGVGRRIASNIFWVYAPEDL